LSAPVQALRSSGNCRDVRHPGHVSLSLKSKPHAKKVNPANARKKLEGTPGTRRLAGTTAAKKTHIRQLEALGFTVTLTPAA
jgi:hypothetical protein